MTDRPKLREALDRISDPELRQEVSDLLGNLLMLAEGATQSFDSSGAKRGKVEGSIPKGVREESSDQAPSADVSLWDHYAFRFGKAALLDDEVELRRLLILATREYEDFLHRPDEDRIEMQRRRDEQKDMQVLLEYGEGKNSAILSAEYRWPIGWIEMVRERNGREPKYGHERPNWREMSDEARYQHIEEMRAEHDNLGQREAAMMLGVSKGNVQRYWRREVAA